MCLHFPACSCVGECQGLAPPVKGYPHGVGPNKRPVSRGAAKYDGMPCPYCGERMSTRSEERYPTVDHILPRRRHGLNLPGNTIRVCQRCNHDKRCHLISDWHKFLVRERDQRAPFVADVIALLRAGQLVG